MSSHPRQKHIKIKEKAKPTNHVIIQDIKNTNVSLGSLLLNPQSIYLHYSITKKKIPTTYFFALASSISYFIGRIISFIILILEMINKTKDRSDKIFFFFWRNKHTHKDTRVGKGVLTQRHTTNSTQKPCNF